MIILSVAVSIVLGLIALLHLYWSFGGLFGVSSAAPIIEGKEGKNEFKVPKFLTFVVACLIASLAVLAVLLVSDKPVFGSNLSYLKYFGYAVAIVFIIRSIGDFKYLGFFKKIYNSSFAKKDTVYFSPLCLMLGLAFIVLSKHST